MPPKVARLAGLGAYGACTAFIALFALLAYVSRHTATGGMTTALAVVTWISLGLVFASLIAVHVVIARRLLELARGGSYPA
jgi:TRAP-type C4-dicarboxylate transport system permease small subunit